MVNAVTWGLLSLQVSKTNTRHFCKREACLSHIAAFCTTSGGVPSLLQLSFIALASEKKKKERTSWMLEAAR